MIGHMDDDELTPDELEQLARSLTMDGSLGRADAQRAAEVLREAAARRRHPARPQPALKS
jgi:tellurite resistance protein